MRKRSRSFEIVEIEIETRVGGFIIFWESWIANVVLVFFIDDLSWDLDDLFFLSECRLSVVVTYFFTGSALSLLS